MSTSGTDSDWVVKLIDVYPDDYRRTGTPNPPSGEIRRLPAARPRRRDARQVSQQPREAGAVRAQPADAACNFTLQDVAHTFRSGHKIMVQVQSTWFPLVDRNPQKFVDIYSANEADFQKATPARLPQCRDAVASGSARGCALI